nr:Yip1 family protein [uncultured Bacillus sp.]
MEHVVNEEQAKPNLFAMLWSPVKQFERIRQKPKVWIPLLIVVILYAAVSAINALSMTTDDLTAVGTPVDQAEMILGFSKVMGIVQGFISPIFIIFISAAIYFIFIKIARKDTTFMQLLSMTTFIFFISTIGFLLNSLISLMIGSSSGIGDYKYVTSLATVLNSDSPVLDSFELFSIWQLILTAIGLHKVGQLSKTAVIIIAVVFFGIGIGISLISVALSGLAAGIQ